MKVTLGKEPGNKLKLKQYIVNKKEELTKMVLTDPEHRDSYILALEVLSDITLICDERKKY